ncbi:MAG: NAD-dependent epimerase/dehydratase family protein [Terrimicrobiaceae bacterium]|nr:hypothetical protein [Terrimicrobiaceae bacterium]
MKAVISGTSGYVGGAISDAFKNAGWTVRQPGSEAGRKWRLPEEPDSTAFDGATGFIHAAWDMRPRNASTAGQTNIGGSQKLLRAAVKSGVGKPVFISSLSSFAGCRSMYGRMKQVVEKDFLESGGVVVRPGLVYGAASGGMVGKLLRLASTLPMLPVPCPNALQYLVHQETLAGFVFEAGSGRIPTGIYSVAHPRPMTLAQIIKILAATAQRSPVVIPVPWRIAWLGLKILGTCGVRLPFSADNLVGLAKANPQPDFSALKNLGIHPPAFPAGMGGRLK